jgi:hypothetical protein
MAIRERRKGGVGMKKSESGQGTGEWFDWFNDQSGDEQIPFGD